MSLKSILKQLRMWRKLKDRQSVEIVKMWVETLSSSLQKLGSEKLTILEQVFISALDCNKPDIAQKCIEELHKDSPDSLQVRIYEAMYLEAEEKYEEALEILEDIVRQDEKNTAARKRKVAILKAQNKSSEAIKELNDYVDLFKEDFEAWQELAELYINEQDFKKAAFWIMELMLRKSIFGNPSLGLKYADIKYTQGGLYNVKLAYFYYFEVATRRPTNMRALYGLYLAATVIATSRKSSLKWKTEALGTYNSVLNRIQQLYKQAQVSNIEERFRCLRKIDYTPPKFFFFE